MHPRGAGGFPPLRLGSDGSVRRLPLPGPRVCVRAWRGAGQAGPARDAVVAMGTRRPLPRGARSRARAGGALAERVRLASAARPRRSRPARPPAGTMLPSSIQISGEPLSGAEVRDICRGLRDNAVRLLSLRGCRLCDRDFGRICRALAGATALAQLNLNLGVVSSPGRVRLLADALRSNRSVQSLFLHGSPLTDAGLALLNPALALHPALVALDLGDCMLGDEAINLICGLLPPDGAKSGLKELTLSANPGITPKGWSRLAIAVAHSSQVRVLNLDYNPLGDHVAGMLAVAVASSRTLEVLDLEGTGLTNQSAQTLLDMVENYPTALRSLVLAENSISPELQQQICDLLSEGEEEEEAAGAAEARERERGQESEGHQRGNSSWICPHDSSSQMVLMTSGLGDSLLAETEM